MAATITDTTARTAPTDADRRPGSLRRTTAAAGLAAAAVTTAAAVALHGAGVSFAVDGEMIPLAGFAQLTFLGAVIGGVLLAVLNRRSSSARRQFVRATVVFTAVWCVPSVAWPDRAATKVSLVCLHVLAAAIIVPVLARDIAD